ncbi:MAG TPA: CGNR zinc finger domain-containing protein [Gemmatimonadaceae bacterium]|nr:CGNR zinc finger domain-containing protein [Gemmatimonadaceae bacterium]
MRNIPEALHDFDYIGGSLVLDFTNVGTHAGHNHEHLRSYSDLVDFVRQAGGLSPSGAHRLVAEAERHPSAAKAVLGRAIALRDASMRVFTTFARRKAPDARDLELIGREAAAALAHRRIALAGKQITWTWADELTLERVLWPIAQSAADLLTSDEDRVLLRECASDTCEWLFLDRTRNHSRRWCDMADCGNRAKQQRLRARTRTQGTAKKRK